MTTISPTLTLGEPRVTGPLALFPVFGPEPKLAYRAFADAIALGASVRELERGASVNDLAVVNPTDLPVLVFEGEEVLGAKQNRTFDVSVLVAAKSQETVPVSCVEQGRWEGGPRAQQPFTPAPQAAHPGLRGSKRADVNAAAAAGAPARANQGAVWANVGQALASAAVPSGTQALNDLYDARRDELAALSPDTTVVPGQVGVLAAVAGRPIALDMVSRTDVLASLLPRLAQGYALDALGASAAATDRDRAEAFLRTSLAAPRTLVKVPGLGRGFGVASDGLVGGGLEHEGEQIVLSAFPRDASPTAGGAISRPTIRRA